MTSFFKGLKSTLVFSLVIVVSLGLQSCSEEEHRAKSQPLQPLIYTEYPDLTPEGAAVREERLIRQLLEGGGELLSPSDSEHRLEPLPLLDDPEELGRALVEALLERDEELFEHAFLSPQAYANLVRVSLSEAGEFVDNQIGGSRGVWELFRLSQSSEMSEGGLSAILRYDGIELGRGRRVDGGVTRGQEEPVQFWGNKVFLRHLDSDLRFEIVIPRVFRIIEGGQHHREREGDLGEENRREAPGEEVFVYQIASPLESQRSFRSFLDAGLHLRPELMRAQEYPFPLRVGNFWRYRRYDRAIGVESIDPLEVGFVEEQEGPSGVLAAREVVLEVQQVSQYGPVRLVELQRSYDDHRYTRVREYWVLTPRQLFACSNECREKIEDIAWLVHYFENQTPLLSFPLRLGQGWGAGGRPSSTPAFEVQEQWHLVESPAGYFPATYAIDGRGALGWWDPFYQRSQVTRYFQPGRGIVRLELSNRDSPMERVDVVEELVEYRLTQ